MAASGSWDCLDSPSCECGLWPCVGLVALCGAGTSLYLLARLALTPAQLSRRKTELSWASVPAGPAVLDPHPSTTSQGQALLHSSAPVSRDWLGMTLPHPAFVNLARTFSPTSEENQGQRFAFSFWPPQGPQHHCNDSHGLGSLVELLQKHLLSLGMLRALCPALTSQGVPDYDSTGKNIEGQPASTCSPHL